MPLTPQGIATVLTPALMATGMLGVSTPQFALGVGVGLTQWAQQVLVLSIDTGTLGAGSSVGPLLVPAPTLLLNLLSSFGSVGITKFICQHVQIIVMI